MTRGQGNCLVFKLDPEEVLTAIRYINKAIGTDLDKDAEAKRLVRYLEDKLEMQRMANEGL